MRRYPFLYIMLVCFFISGEICGKEEIKLKKENGVYTIPCEINGLKLRFILDTGASNVSISLTEASFMYKNGYLDDNDFLGTARTQIASGEIQENYVVNIKQVKIGTKVLYNIKAVVMKGLSAPLLLGQSAISQLGEWSISGDYLILYDRESSDFSKYTESDWHKRIKEVEEGKMNDEDAFKYLLPGVYANDRETILKVGDFLYRDTHASKKDEEYVEKKLQDLSMQNDKDAIFILAGYYKGKNHLKKLKEKNVEDLYKAIGLYEKLIDGKGLYVNTITRGFNNPYVNLYYIYKDLQQQSKALDYLKKGALLNDVYCVSFLLSHYYLNKDYQNLYLWADKLSTICTKQSKMYATYYKAKCLIEGAEAQKNVSRGIQMLRQLVIEYDDVDDEVIIDLCSYYLQVGDYQNVEKYAKKIVSGLFEKNYYLGCAYYFMNDYYSARSYFEILLKKDLGYFGDYEMGHACCLLGYCYENGKGGAVDYKKAEICYMRAYEDHHYFFALCYLGDMYSNENIYIDYNKAFNFYMHGAQNNIAYCCYRVSQFYKLGVAVLEDMDKSAYWLQKAKENGWEEK